MIKTMRLVERHKARGINPHLVWVYEQKGRYAGIDRNFDVLGDRYYCFEGNKGHGEGFDTIWYPTLEAARRVVQKYLSGEIPHIPRRR